MRRKTVSRGVAWRRALTLAATLLAGASLSIGDYCVEPSNATEEIGYQPCLVTYYDLAYKDPASGQRYTVSYSEPAFWLCTYYQDCDCEFQDDVHIGFPQYRTRPMGVVGWEIWWNFHQPDSVFEWIQCPENSKCPENCTAYATWYWDWYIGYSAVAC